MMPRDWKGSIGFINQVASDRVRTSELKGPGRSVVMKEVKECMGRKEVEKGPVIHCQLLSLG